MTDRQQAPLTVYAPPARAPLARGVLAAACRALGWRVNVEWMASGALFHRLRSERKAAQAAVVLSHGPYLLELAAREDLLAPYTPPASPPGQGLTLHNPEGLWHSLDFAPVLVHGRPAADSPDALAGSAVSRLVVPDPGRSEDGMMVLLASLDWGRGKLGHVDRGWDWWKERASSGLLLTGDPGQALDAVQRGAASHALVLGVPPPGAPDTLPVRGFAPTPHTVGLVEGGARREEAVALLDWLLASAGADAVAAGGGLSPWHAGRNGLASLAAEAPAFDATWTFDSYRQARTEWGRQRFSSGAR